MPEDIQPQSQSSLKQSKANKALKRILITVVIFIGLSVIFIFALMAFSLVNPNSLQTEKENTQNTNQAATKSAESASKVSSYSIPDVKGYEKSAYPETGERESYAYIPTTEYSKSLIQNINLVVFRSESPKNSVLVEMELTEKDMKKVDLIGADLAYWGCSEKKIEDNFVVRYAYESCVIAFSKGSVVGVVEARALESNRKSVTKKTGDQMLIEALKIATAFLATVK